jgi:hypothetical protein
MKELVIALAINTLVLIFLWWLSGNQTKPNGKKEKEGR